MRDPGEEDDALVQAARNGDRQAFALLYHRYKIDVWNLAYLTLRNYHEAEDSLQETFIKALRALGPASHVEAVRPWLLAICRNVCLDRLRAARRRPLVSLDDDQLAEPPGPPVDHDQRIDFHRALQTLAAEDREAFMLVDVLGCRSHEAAAILGLRASSTLRSRLARARKQIAPAVGEGSQRGSGEGHAEIWGLYHAPPDSAIVISFASISPNGHGRATVADLLARLESHGPAADAGRNGFGLVDFFERLDDHIPRERRIIAVIDDRPALSAGSTQDWLAEHPRWLVRRPPTHASWLLEVRRLLSAAGTEAGDRQSRALAALDAPAPFFWTQTR